MKPGRWIAGLTLLALVPILVMVLQGAVRHVSADDAPLLLWRAVAIGCLVGLAEIYVGGVVVSRRHVGLAVAWLALLALLAVVLVPGVVGELEGRHVWELFESRESRAWWGVALILLPSLAVAACLWADVVSGGSGLAEEYEQHLLGRLAAADSRVSQLEAELSRLKAETEPEASQLPPALEPCECGYQPKNEAARKGHLAQCRLRKSSSPALGVAEIAVAVGAPEAPA